jgi:Family of unknown function (DUF6368)
MSGSTATLLFPLEAAGAVATWERVVASRATAIRGSDFWMHPLRGPDPRGPLPFFSDVVRCGTREWELEDAETASLGVAFGFPPALGIVTGAMCRGTESDRVLGELALAILAEHQGVLLFQGLLCPELDFAQTNRWFQRPAAERAALFAETLGPYPGKLVVVDAEGEPACHAVDRGFLDFWMQHRAFRFVN